ncbi:hypothetical protein GK047_11885 [Paenibacillus sp. SYP-B3998]|uniref:Uncharacterized protein n=1 Tax=Paenibacillus sp. SYP-B3998 TaxID=2678564 RepID=A0A6G3ZX77_9BACL|nr:hypothetical protein [Paenibacillus sp. SYP-B3998]NEW06715.1 hypothetical protein [Paenibacillus sp. SYP-B3998]
MKGFKIMVSSAFVVVSLLSATLAASAHPLINIQNYSTFNSYKVVLDQQSSYDWSHAHDQWELDDINKQYNADIAIAKVYFSGQGTGYPRVKLEP